MPEPFRDTPLYRFVHQRWMLFSAQLTSSKVKPDDVVLFLVWMLDGLRAGEAPCLDHPYETLREGIRSYGIDHSLNTTPEELDLITTALCAMTLACFGLLFRIDSRHLLLFQQLVQNMGTHSAAVQEARNRIRYDDQTPALQQWLSDFWLTSDYLTVQEAIEWDITPALESQHIAPEEASDAHLSWMSPSIPLDRKRRFLQELRETMQEEIHSYKGKIARKKSDILFATFRQPYMSNRIAEMPSYPIAERLFGDLNCLPSEANYYKACIWIKAGEKE